VGTDFDPVLFDDDNDVEVLSFGSQRTTDWSRVGAAVFARRGVRWVLGSVVALALALTLAAPWQHAPRRPAAAPPQSPRPQALVPSSGDEYVLSVPAVDLSGVLDGPQCPVTAGCSVTWLADRRLAAQMSAFFDVDAVAGGDIVDSAGRVIFQSIAVRNQAHALIHLVAARSPTLPATAPTLSRQSHEGAVTVRVSGGRNGWSIVATITGRGAAPLPLEQVQRWVLTSPLPS